MACEKMYVIFDLDDTLYPESEYVLSGFKTVAEYLSISSDMTVEEIYNKLRSDFEDGVRGKNFDRLLQDTGIDADVENLVHLYRTHTPDIEITGDSKTCLNQLSNRWLGIVTDGKATKQKNKIQGLGISDKFDTIYISGEFGPDSGKPSTDMFDRLISDTRHIPEEMVYVGDNPKKDFVAPNDLGMRSIWVDRPWGEYTELEPTTNKESPTARVEDLTDVPELIRKWEADL